MSAAETLPAPTATRVQPAAVDPLAAARAARECAMQAGDLKLANAYFMLADALAENARLAQTSEFRRASALDLARKVGQLEAKLVLAEAEIATLRGLR